MPLHPVILSCSLIFSPARLSQEPVEGRFIREDLLPLLPPLEVEGKEKDAEADDLVKTGDGKGKEGEGGVGHAMVGRGAVAGEGSPEEDPRVPEPEEIGDSDTESGDKQEVTHGNTN